MVPLPDPESIRRVADWIELNLSIGAERLSKAQVTSAIESLTGAEPAESFISDVWRELAYRQRLYSQPLFQLNDRAIERRPEVEVTDEYLACLILSLYGVRGTTR